MKLYTKKKKKKLTCAKKKIVPKLRLVVLVAKAGD